MKVRFVPRKVPKTAGVAGPSSRDNNKNARGEAARPSGSASASAGSASSAAAAATNAHDDDEGEDEDCFGKNNPCVWCRGGVFGDVGRQHHDNHARGLKTRQ